MASRRPTKRKARGYFGKDSSLFQSETGLANRSERPSATARPVESAVLTPGAPVNPEIPPIKHNTEMFTYFTRPTAGTLLLYSAENWVRARLMLETAGDVVVATNRQNITPVLSGKGILLPFNVEITFPLSKNNRIFIASNTVNRVKFIIEPIPWQEQIALMLSKSIEAFLGGRR